AADAVIDDEVTDSSEKPARSPFNLYEGQNCRVERQDPDGQTVFWSTEFDARRGFLQPPHLLYDDQRVYVSSSSGGVTALDANSGRSLWHSDGPGDRMCLHDGLLLATQCGSSPVI